MDKLVSMKRSKKERSSEVAVPSSDYEEYGWGLSIRLENVELDKLDMSRLPRVGDKFDLAAKVKVTAVHESDYESADEVDRGVSLQITDMNLT